MKTFYFDGENGEKIREESIPEELLVLAEEKREELIDVASMFSDDLMEAALEGNVTEELLISVVRIATLQRKITPVFIGSAYKNKGVQLLLDAVENYLPCPSEVENRAISLENEEDLLLSNSVSDPVVALAFKLEDGQYGQLTYIRVYQGTISKGDTLINARTMKKIKIGRLIRMHADQMEDISSISAGYIGALFGVDCSSGDTLFSMDMEFGVSMTSMFVPAPVISLAIVPSDNSSQIKLSKALN
jgi:elongation factor G